GRVVPLLAGGEGAGREAKPCGREPGGGARDPMSAPLRLGATLAVVLGCLAWAPARAPGSEAAPNSGPRGEVRDLLERINRRRAAIGCRPLLWDGRLAQVAWAHSRDMARRGFFSHE